MSWDKEYKNRSDTEKGFDAKLKRIEKEAYDENRSPTGYGQSMLGMDDVDKIRRKKFKTL